MSTKLFTPRYKEFYGLFEKMSIKLEEIGKNFDQLVQSPDIEDAKKNNEVVKNEYAAIKDIANETLIKLQVNFITPFDREDIVELVNSLNGMASHMNTTSRRLMIYDMFPMDTITLEFSSIVNEGAALVNRAMHLLRKGKMGREMDEIVRHLYDFEDQADELYNAGLKKVLDDDNDFKTFFKTKDIYQKMELITDEMETIGNVLEGIKIKYA